MKKSAIKIKENPKWNKMKVNNLSKSKKKKLWTGWDASEKNQLQTVY